MLLKRPKLIVHSNLEEQEIIEIGWSFKYLADDDKDKVRDIYCLEMKIDGLEDKDILYDLAFQFRTKIAEYIFDERLGQAYLFLVEYQPLSKSRTRSYKGLFPYEGQIKKGDCLEFEFELLRGETFFMGVAPITEDNRDECFAIAKDPLRAFILISSEQLTNVYTRVFLESIIPCLNIKGNIIIDFMKLIPKLCSQGFMIFGFASDTRGGYININSFFSKEMATLVDQSIRQAVNEAITKQVR